MSKTAEYASPAPDAPKNDMSPSQPGSGKRRCVVSAACPRTIHSTTVLHRGNLPAAKRCSSSSMAENARYIYATAHWAGSVSTSRGNMHVRLPTARISASNTGPWEGQQCNEESASKAFSITASGLNSLTATSLRFNPFAPCTDGFDTHQDFYQSLPAAVFSCPSVRNQLSRLPPGKRQGYRFDFHKKQSACLAALLVFH